MPSRPPSRSPSPAAPRKDAPGGRTPQRRAQTTLAALRTGVTAFAVLAGLACYFFLTQVGVTGVLAVVAGLVFALLVRVAAMSLLREWLLAAAHRRASSPPEAPSPPPPPAAPRAPRR
ncbi:MAG TPA: hypothetical protein VF116_14150 [Ktedonobacterales bacterium]